MGYRSCKIKVDLISVEYYQVSVTLNLIIAKNAKPFRIWPEYSGNEGDFA